MPQYVTLPSPNKNWWEPAANQTSNMLWQLAQMKMAHNMRLEEVDRQLEAKKIELQEQRSYDEERVQKPLNMIPVEIDGKQIGVAVRDPIKGTFQMMSHKETKDSANENLTATQKDFERAQRDPAFAKYVQSKPQWGADPNRPRDQELQELQATNTLNNEFNNRSKDFLIVRDSYNRIQTAANEPSAAGDLALIFSYMKVLDPGSTVRESEQANAQNAAGVPERIRALYNKVITGERLGETQRADFVKTSKNLYSAQEKTHKQLRAEFENKAKRWRLNPQDVITDYLAPTSAGKQPEGQQPGAQTPPKQRPPLGSFKR